MIRVPFSLAAVLLSPCMLGKNSLAVFKGGGKKGKESSENPTRLDVGGGGGERSESRRLDSDSNHSESISLPSRLQSISDGGRVEF